MTNPPLPSKGKFTPGESHPSFTPMGERFIVWLGDDISKAGAQYRPGPKFSTYDEENVRKCQVRMGDTPDPVGEAYFGPRQWDRLFDPPPGGGSGQQPWLAKAGSALLAQVNTTYPDRDTRTDGWIGDEAHCGPGKPPSEHCPDPETGVVRAVDIDADLLPGKPRGESQRLADAIVEAGRKGDERLWYVIHNGRIRSVTYGWEDRPYGGADPHESHIHVSFKPAGDDDGRAFDLDLDDPDPEGDLGEVLEALARVEAKVDEVLARADAPWRVVRP